MAITKTSLGNLVRITEKDITDILTEKKILAGGEVVDELVIEEDTGDILCYTLASTPKAKK